MYTSTFDLKRRIMKDTYLRSAFDKVILPLILESDAPLRDLRSGKS